MFDQELLDFLNKAPIAMHWLSATGHVLWANETEMNVLGYTADEYIGQPIMNFCPDEQELVLEIFKTLGTGNTIKDVPVRFRAKNGDIKYLLIDSNVNWNPDGTFKHTRCFIRDDTARKVREARLEERHRSVLEMAKAKDKFMRKVFHEIKTPCHLLSSVLDGVEECEAATSAALLADVRCQARALRDLVDDAVDAALFDDGRVPVFTPSAFSLHRRVNDLCRELESEFGGRSGPRVERVLSFGISSGALAEAGERGAIGLLRVLLVEGNAAQRTLLKSILSKDVRCECVLASDGAAALRAAGDGGGFSAVLLGGVADVGQKELCGQLRRALVGAPEAPIIAIAEDEGLLAAGAARQLAKPVDRQQLKAALDEVLPRPGPAARARPAASAGTWASGAGLCGQVPDMVEGDWRYLSRVLRHLLTNALKHTTAGRVGLSVAYELGRFRFSVTDTGPGVDADEVRSLFQRFWHLRAPPPPADGPAARGEGAGAELDDLATDSEGLGLGLNVSYHIVESMGGTLEVDSRPGAGETVFYFSVPLAVLPEQQQAPAAL